MHSNLRYANALAARKERQDHGEAPLDKLTALHRITALVERALEHVDTQSPARPILLDALDVAAEVALDRGAR